MSRTFVITGGGSGLGRAFARTLAADGHRLVLLGRRLDKVEAVAAETGNGSFALACDVADPASVADAFAEIAARCGAIDGLINNAAVFKPFKVVDATPARIDEITDTDYKGPIHCVRAALPLLGRGSVIVNVGSESVTNRVPMFALYQSVKLGLERFTKALHQELADEGIRVTLLRVCRMADEDSVWDIDPDIGRQFIEENAKRGIVQSQKPIASFASAAAQLRWLVNLPPDVAVTEVFLEARAP